MDLTTGDCIRMSSFTLVEPDIRLTYKAEKDKVFVLMLMGVETKDKSKPLDIMSVMDKLGWMPKNSNLRLVHKR